LRSNLGYETLELRNKPSVSLLLIMIMMMMMMILYHFA